MVHVPPTNHRTTTPGTIDRGPTAPQISVPVSSGKLFGGKVNLRVGFDWRTNTLWVDWPGKELRYIGDANLIESIQLHKSTTSDGSSLPLMFDDVMVVAGSSSTSWFVSAKVVDQPNLPPFRAVVELSKKGEAKLLRDRLQALLDAQR